jgi:LDH2 family malate/lactate/ureidoglycolate dehydrogenase
VVTRVPADELAAYLDQLYRAAGMTGDRAAVMAAAHVEADLRGIPGHGSRLAPGYLGKLRDGRLNARPEITVLHTSDACLVLDADLAPGPVAARCAVEASMRLARRCGTGLVVVRRAGHAGALGTAATWAGGQGFISVLAAPASSPSVALFGGTGSPLLGNSALAVAVPASDQPVVLDMAASSTSWGCVHQRARTGQNLPDGCALNAAGWPTQDPCEASVLLPAGERGQAAAIILQAVLGALAATGPLPDGVEGRGLLSLAIDPARLGAPELAVAVDELSRAVRAEGARMPGDRAQSHRAAALRGGIDLDDADLAALIATGRPDVPAPPEWTSRQPAQPITADKEVMP